MRRPGLPLGLLATLSLSASGSAGCLLLGKHYDAASWRELRRVDHTIAAPVDADGFYPAAACASACPAFGESVERCYPVAVDVPVLPERIVSCNFLYGATVRRAVPRAAAEAARVENVRRPGYADHIVDPESCEHFCDAKERRLVFCNLEPDLPPTPAGQFVVCIYHRPAGSNLVIW